MTCRRPRAVIFATAAERACDVPILLGKKMEKLFPLAM
jgi:hypothetical protein